MKFASKLALYLLTILIFIIIAITSFVYMQETKKLENEISYRLEEKAFSSMNKLDIFLHERKSDIIVLSSLPKIRSRNTTPEEKTNILFTFRDTYKTYLSLSFFDKDRIRIADTSGLDIGNQNEMQLFFKEVLDGKVSAGSDIEISPSLHMPVVYFASSVKDEKDEILGTVVSRVPITKIQDILTSGEIDNNFGSDDEYLDLVDENGTILYSTYNKSGILKDKFSIWNKIKEKSKITNMGNVVDIVNGEKSIIVFAKEQGYLDFEGNNWTIIIHIPTKSAFAPAIELRNELLIIMLPVLVIIVFFVMLFSISITKPITKLKNSAENISKGNLAESIEIKSKDEIGELAKSFDEMRLELKDRNDLLNTLLNTFKGKFGNIATILVRKDIERLVKKNPRIQNIIPRSVARSINNMKNASEKENKKKHDVIGELP